jgi:hypothetical protein
MITIIKDIPAEKLTEHKDYINHLFRNSNGVYNICRTEEDVVKSNQWLSNLPKRAILIDEDLTIEPGDRFIARATNRSLDGKIFKLIGPTEGGDGLIDIEDENGDLGCSTIFLLEGSLKIVREATTEDIENVVNAKCAILEIK